MNETDTPQPLETLVTPDEAADWFQVTVHTIGEWEGSGAMPRAIRRNGVVRFCHRELLQWLGD